MVWRRATGREPGPALFSNHSTKIWSAALLVLMAGAIGGVLCSVVHLVLPSAAPLICGAGVMIAMFAVTFALVHLMRWIEPIALAKTVYLLGVLLLGGFFGVSAVFGLPVLSDMNLGGFAIVMIVLIGALPPTLLVLLAIGDRPPPVDETRLGEPPRL